MKSIDLHKLLARYRVTDGARFHLKDYRTDDLPAGLVDKDDADELLAEGVKRLSDLQELLYARHSWSLLAVFQAMDAAGKDGTIKHVMSGVNPQGVRVTSFKAPGPEELDHGFLWRVGRALPERGRIGIFNRSHYEEVLVVRVHPALLAGQNLPDTHIGKKFWKHRLEDIEAFERHLSRQGMVILKFFLHVSPAEQKRRLLERMDTPGKNWKFNPGDIAERAHWDTYMDAYEQAIQATATKHAPWFVVPADRKWFARLVVVGAMIDALERLEMKPPELPNAARAQLAAARAQLLEED